jgi:hypothetical protein
MADIRQFLRLQSNDWLTALRDKVAADLLSNVQTTSISLNGKTTGQTVQVAIADLAEQLTTVLEERGLVPESHTNSARMGLARFS